MADKRIFLILALVYVLLTIPTFFGFTGDTSWIVTLVSRSLRLSLWVIVALYYFPKEKIFWLILVAIFLNIPADISDIVFIDKYDDLFKYLRICLLIPALYLIIKSIITNRD